MQFSAGQHATAMDVPVVYMEVPYSDIYISPNGIVGFGDRLPDGVTPLQRLNKSAIAPFYAPASDGTVYYRLFPLALASDGMISYALIQFLALPWSASAGTYAQSGFAMPDGRYQSNTNSGGPDVKELVGYATLSSLM
ncbi:hypothetical protein ANCCAN_22739 [Ancylostoma caninum]|uniref:Nidogen-like protein n=1 Tax=Ancylostoma caninum TaxID=29170 RepID=A0A368FH69_ANCCA|nr:hypothetical protein ANCCAN_22739 [Ancylostoma caninum]